MSILFVRRQCMRMASMRKRKSERSVNVFVRIQWLKVKNRLHCDSLSLLFLLLLFVVAVSPNYSHYFTSIKLQRIHTYEKNGNSSSSSSRPVYRKENRFSAFERIEAYEKMYERIISLKYKGVTTPPNYGLFS